MAAIGTNNRWISEFEDAARPLPTVAEYDAMTVEEKERVLAAYGFHPHYAKFFINHDSADMRLSRSIWGNFIQRTGGKASNEK